MHVFWIKQYYYWHHRCCQKQFYIYISNELNPLRELFWKCLSQNSFEIIKIFFINWILQIVLSIIIKVVLYFHQKFSLNYIFSKTTFFFNVSLHQNTVTNASFTQKNYTAKFVDFNNPLYIYFDQNIAYFCLTENKRILIIVALIKLIFSIFIFSV